MSGDFCRLCMRMKAEICTFCCMHTHVPRPRMRPPRIFILLPLATISLLLLSLQLSSVSIGSRAVSIPQNQESWIAEMRSCELENDSFSYSCFIPTPVPIPKICRKLPRNRNHNSLGVGINTALIGSLNTFLSTIQKWADFARHLI